jgi:hypothetical protein
MPDLGEMLASGLSTKHCERVRSSFVVPRIKDNETRIRDPLLDLVTNFDVSTLEIGPVSFDQRYKEYYPQYDHVTIFAMDDADFLVIDNQTNEIAVVDSQSDGNVIGFCAKDGTHFLEALLEMARRTTVHYPFSRHNLPVIDRCGNAKACTAKAGGGEYLWFYKVALGCDE